MVLRGWGVRVGVVAVIGVVPLAGCSEGATPVVTPTPTITAPVVQSPEPDPTPTPEPTPTELTEEELLAAIPEAVSEDLWGAFAVASALVQESQNLLVTRDPLLFQAMSSESCTFCSATLDYLREIETEGQTFKGGQIEILDEMPSGGLQSDGTWHLEFGIEVEPTVVLDADAQVIEEVAAQKYVVAVALERHENSWLVIDVGSERS